MKKKRFGLISAIMSLLVLPLVIMTSACEKILSFEDLRAIGFSGMKGAGVGRKYAPNEGPSVKKRASDNMQSDMSFFSLNENNEPEDVSFEDDNGKEKSIGLHLYRYGSYGKYAAMVYIRKDYGTVYRYGHAENYYEGGHWYTFVFSFVTGKLYYLDLENIDRYDCFESYENQLICRANKSKNSGYATLLMTETSDGLVVENLEKLDNLVASGDRSEVGSPGFSLQGFGRDGRILFGGYIFRNPDGTYYRSNYDCDVLIDGRYVAGIKKQDDLKPTIYIYDENLNPQLYEDDEMLLCKRSIWAGKYSGVSIMCDVLYQDKNDVFYCYAGNSTLWHMHFDEENNKTITKIWDNISFDIFYWLYKDNIVVYDFADNHIRSINFKTYETHDLYDLNSIVGDCSLSRWQYGPGGYFYITGQRNGEEIKGYIKDGSFVETEFDENNLLYDISATYKEEMDSLVSKHIPNNKMIVKTLKSIGE